MKKLIFIGILLFLSNPLSAQNNNVDQKQSYELQRQCREDAAKFAHEFLDSPKTNIGQIHYNKRLNKCLAYVDFFESKFIFIEIVDVNENISIGFGCTLAKDKPCPTKEMEKLMTE